MDRNNSNDGNNMNFPNNPNFQYNQNNPPLDPSLLSNPQFQAALQWYSSQSRPINVNNIPQCQPSFPFPQSSSSSQQPLGDMSGFPISEHFTQNIDQSLGGFGGSNATPIEGSGDEHVEQLVGAQHLEDIDDVDVEIVPEQNVNATGQRKNQSWSIAEDKALVSAYINAGGDVVIGTKTKKSGLWVEIYNHYESSRIENPDEIKVRNIKSMQNRWDFINLHCGKLVDAYRYHYQTKGSGEFEQNLEKFAHKDYYATNNKMFCFLHCFETLRKYPKWDPSLTKDQSNMLPGGLLSVAVKDHNLIHHPRLEEELNDLVA
ncbi:uncharacterized protein LOC110689889 [Chenopodium quinoa]|uniref:uncharacterized protein LOC110689889 n=1 Tax=Chenopodium quinoa TaxID=63459 RepID=UPI000B7855FE|nr:uncharacterized protein LOC110689889 [Chenopodium quinoa]